MGAQGNYLSEDTRSRRHGVNDSRLSKSPLKPGFGADGPDPVLAHRESAVIGFTSGRAHESGLGSYKTVPLVGMSHRAPWTKLKVGTAARPTP